MARKLIALIKPMPPKPIFRMTEEELNRHAEQLRTSHLSGPPPGGDRAQVQRGSEQAVTR